MPFLYLTGVDADDRSIVTERRDLEAGSAPFEALRVEDAVPIIPEGAAGVTLLESPTAPGGAVYNIYTWHSGQRTPMHRTSTIDFDVVLKGSMDMVLETETVTLHAGDCVVLTGIAHAWVSGPDGALVMYNLISGTASGADLGRDRAPFG